MRSVLTLLAILAIAVPVFAANPTLESFSNPDFVVDTNSPPLNGPSNVVHTALSVRSGNSPGDQFFLTVNGTNIALLQSASFNPTVGTLPIRGATNWLDSRILQPSANVVNIGTNASFDLGNGRLTVTKTTGGSFLPLAALDQTSYPDSQLAEIGGASMILTPRTNHFYDFTVTGTTAGRGMEFRFANSQPILTLSSNQNVIIGNNTSSANRSTNYLYIPFGTGVPVGTPKTEGSHPAMYWDSTGDLLYIWSPSTGWHIVGTNIFYGTNNFTINPTDWKVPYRVNATTLGDTGMHPTNVNDMIFDGTIDATTITSHDTLNAAGAFVLSRSGAFPITTTNPNQIDVVNLGFVMMTSDVDATDPTLRTITLNTGHVGQIIEIENTTNVFVGVTQSAFSLTNGTPLFDDASKYVFLSGGDWNTTNSGEGIWLQYNGLYWHEIDRVAGPGGGSGNLSGSGTPGYIPVWTSATGLGNSRLFTNGNNLVSFYNAAATAGGIIVSNVSGANTASIGLRANGDAQVTSSSGFLWVPNVTVSGTMVPQGDNTYDLGSSASSGAYRDSFLKGKVYSEASNDGAGNYSRLATYSSGGLGIFDLQNAGTGTPFSKFSFRSNGVEVAFLPGGGGGGGAGGGGNMTNTGPSVAGMIPTYTDTSGTQVTPTNAVPALEAATLTVTGTMNLPITNQVLVTDGSGNVVGGGDPFVWTSHLADNATNVAMVVDTSNAWSITTPLGQFRDNGTNKLTVFSTGGLFLGNTNLTAFTDLSSTDLALMQVNRTDLGDPNGGGFEFWTAMTSDADSGGHILGNLSTNTATLLVGTDYTLDQGAQEVGIETSATSVDIYGMISSSIVFLIQPGVDASTTPYSYSTSLPHSSGNLMEMQNYGTNVFTVAYDGSVTAAGTITTPSLNVGTINFTNPPALPSFTVAGLPGVASAGQIAWCSDTLNPYIATGAMVVYDGTAWRLQTSKITPAATLYGYMCNAASAYWSGSTPYDSALGTSDGSGTSYNGGLFNFGQASSGTSGSGNSVTVPVTGYSHGYFYTAAASPSGASTSFPNLVGLGSGTLSAISFSACMAPSAPCDGTDTYTYMYGIMNQIAVTNLPTFGVFVLYDRYKLLNTSAATGITNNWQFVTCTNATYTFTDTGLAVGTLSLSAIADRISVVWSGHSAVCFTNGVACATNTTNLPEGTETLTYGFHGYKSTGSTLRYLSYDYARVHFRRTNPVSGL